MVPFKQVMIMISNQKTVWNFNVKLHLIFHKITYISLNFSPEPSFNTPVTALLHFKMLIEKLCAKYWAFA